MVDILLYRIFGKHKGLCERSLFKGKPGLSYLNIEHQDLWRYIKALNRTFNDMHALTSFLQEFKIDRKERVLGCVVRCEFE